MTTKTKKAPTTEETPVDANVAVDPTQLPVEVPLVPAPTVESLIALSGFEQLRPVFRATADWLVQFHLAGRTLSTEEGDDLTATVALMRRTIASMSPE
jgi:hypothetical protein